MRREILTPLAIAVGAVLAAAACTANDPDPVSTGPATTPPTTNGTPSTLPTVGGTDPVTPGGRPQPFGSSRLGFFGDCPALLDYMQDEASARVGPYGLDGGGYYLGDDVRVLEEAEFSADAAGDTPTLAQPSAGGAEVDFSGTNTQEVGVDEGDIVETDGRYVYVANQDGLRIVSVADAEVVAQPDLPNGSHQLLLDGSRLLVVTSSWTGSADTIVSLYDVTDPNSPALLRRSHLEGQILATRSVDGVARLVVSTSFGQRLDFVQPDEFGLDNDRALARNREIIEESSVEDWLPRWFDEAGDGSFDTMRPILDCGDVAAPRDFAGLGLTWIASVDMQGDAVPTGSAGIVSTGQTVYASTDNLYVATQNWDWQFGAWEVVFDDQGQETQVDPGPPPTLIHMFALGAGTEANYVASGEVEGRLLNQFAMSEFDGDLRVATTVDDWRSSDETESKVTVLRPDGEELEVLSSIGGLGEGEQIFAVRFLGETAYVVTFRQIDPLYVLDLSDPANPVLQGELKIPGYSAYLHPVGDGLLLGVGQDATDQGQTLGTQLSLFDVSDPLNPQRIDTLPIGGYSEVEWDHKAFLYWPEDGTIVLPVSPGWGDCGPNDDCIAEDIIGAGGGAVVASLDGRQLSARGVVNHNVANDFGCWNPMQRSIAIDDELVTVGLDQLKFSDRITLQARDSVAWGDPEQYGCYWYWEG
jgi:hypothetical protein